MNLIPRLWTTSQELTSDPFRAMRREMENALRAFDQNSSSADIGAGAPAISVAETKDAFEVTAELPGVDEKDIKVSLEENQLVISGEKKAESTKEEKDWHVEERSYGSFYRSMSLPFEPEDGAVDAHFDKGVLHLTIKKPAKAVKATKTINIKDRRCAPDGHGTEEGRLILNDRRKDDQRSELIDPQFRSPDFVRDGEMFHGSLQPVFIKATANLSAGLSYIGI